jgi:hypothetical protein
MVSRIHTFEVVPGFFVHADEGCSLAPSCLSCPLPECRYLLKPKQARANLRRTRIRELFAQGLTVEQAAVELGISSRAVYRHKAIIREELPS